MRAPAVEIRRLSVTHRVSQGVLRPKREIRAVRDVSLQAMQGEVLAIVGESGSGKSTIAMAILGLNTPSTGEVLIHGRPVGGIGRRELAREIQPVFQDPYSSLNPRRSIATTVAQPLVIHGIGTPRDRRRQAIELMERVGLPARFADAMPAQLSGGQRQRVAIARALVMQPKILLCDEPTSALDVSVQAQILNLLLDLRRDFDLTFVLITHNLAVVEHLADRVVVLHRGSIVEEGNAQEVLASPKEPYTRSLLHSVLTPDPHLGLPEDIDIAVPAASLP